MPSSGLSKELLSIHGEVRPQPPTEWKGELKLPTAIEQYYWNVGPVDVTIRSYGNPFFLPSLAELWTFQSGYRWNGLTGVPIADWNVDWLVVGEEGGDPFIFSRSHETVLYAYHGEGKWEPAEMFPDLNAMACCLAQLGAIVLEAGDSFIDEECFILPEWRERSFYKIRDILGSATQAQSILEALGWG